MKPYFQNPQTTLYQGDCLEVLKLLPSDSIDCCVTSPPYFQLCDYQVEGQYGLEETIDLYLSTMTAVFNEVRRVLVNGACCWIIVGDTMNNYSPIRAKGQRRKTGDYLKRRDYQQGFREKELLDIPGKLKDALRVDGWLHRNTLIWDKGTCGTIANSDTAAINHEPILQMGKWNKGGRPYLNCQPLKTSILRYAPASDPLHPCPLPEGLVAELMTASTEEGQTVLEPFAGSGTTLWAAQGMGRKSIGIELNPAFCDAIEKQCQQLTIFGVA